MPHQQFWFVRACIADNNVVRAEAALLGERHLTSNSDSEDRSGAASISSYQQQVTCSIEHVRLHALLLLQQQRAERESPSGTSPLKRTAVACHSAGACRQQGGRCVKGVSAARRAGRLRAPWQRCRWLIEQGADWSHDAMLKVSARGCCVAANALYARTLPTFVLAPD